MKRILLLCAVLFLAGCESEYREDTPTCVMQELEGDMWSDYIWTLDGREWRSEINPDEYKRVILEPKHVYIVWSHFNNCSIDKDVGIAETADEAKALIRKDKGGLW